MPNLWTKAIQSVRTDMDNSNFRSMRNSLDRGLMMSRSKGNMRNLRLWILHSRS